MMGLSMIDWKRVSELKADFGEDDFLEIVEMFLMEVESKLQELPGKSLRELPEDFHFLKGSAANLGFRAFQAMCSQYEKAPDPAEIPNVIQLFRDSKSAFLAGADASPKVA